MEANKDSELDRHGSTESSAWPLSGGGDSENAYFFNEFEWNLQPADQTGFELDPISSDPCSTSATNLTASAPRHFESFKGEDEVGESSKARKGAPASTSSSEDPPEKSISACKSPKTKGEKRMRQPRFAFMTKSEVDHLEDGFRWRKYGQKAVKNSPFPRSYYRCTNSKCTVKKRVERSFEDPTIVITTYEGQHCHHSIGFPRGGVIGHEAPILANSLTSSSSGHNFPHSGMALRQAANAQLREAAALEAARASATLPLSKPIPRRPPPNEGLLGDIVPGMSNQMP